MKKYRLNYESLLKVTKALSMSKDPKEIIRITVDNVKETLNMKGCALYLINEETNEFKLAASHGLSEDYLGKGPVSVPPRCHILDRGAHGYLRLPRIPARPYPEAAKRKELSRFSPYPFMSAGR